MIRLFAFAAALFSLAVMGPVQVNAQAPGQASDAGIAAPNVVVQRWLQAIHAEDYATAWSLMSEHSQNYVVKAVAAEAKMDEGVVRALFDKNDPRVVAGYWTSFRRSSLAGLSKVNDVPARVISNDGAFAIVGFDGFARQWKCFFENGSWKFGMTETFIDR